MNDPALWVASHRKIRVKDPQITQITQIFSPADKGTEAVGSVRIVKYNETVLLYVTSIEMDDQTYQIIGAAAAYQVRHQKCAAPGLCLVR
jgi:hypothetical protein